MKVDIFILSFNRPDCLEKLVSSLFKQKDHTLSVNAIQCFQDGPRKLHLGDDTRKIKNCIQIIQTSGAPVTLHISEKNLGPNGNCQRVWQAISQSSADAVLFFEDDLELSPLYFSAMETLLSYAETCPHIGMVSAHGMLPATLDKQRARKTGLIPMAYLWGVHHWGWGAIHTTAEMMAPIVLEYFKYCKKVGYAGDMNGLDIYVPKVNGWMHQLGFYQDWPMIGYDASYDLAGFLLNKIHINTYACYAKSTGTDGVSFSEESFREYGYHKTVLMDAMPHSFEKLSNTQWLQLKTLVRGYHSSWLLRGLNTDHEYHGITRPEALKYYYETIMGWSLDEDDLASHHFHTLVKGIETIQPISADVLSRPHF